jgi:hypothetical protein
LAGRAKIKYHRNPGLRGEEWPNFLKSWRYISRCGNGQLAGIGAYRTACD